MSRFLFWNTRGNPIKELVSELVAEQCVDVVMLAECAIADSDMCRALLNATGSLFGGTIDQRGKEDIALYYRQETGILTPFHDTYSSIISTYIPKGSYELILATVHLPSKLHAEPLDQQIEMSALCKAITECERTRSHSRTVVVGDFNLDPFEDAMVGAAFLHAVMDRQTAAKGSRTVRGVKYEFFYNPMWGRMGDTSPGPPGTHYYNKAIQRCQFWHTLDQVVLRPTLLGSFSNQDLHVIDTIAGKPLLTSRGIPDRRISDHLPLIFTIAPIQ